MDYLPDVGRFGGRFGRTASRVLAHSKVWEVVTRYEWILSQRSAGLCGLV